MHQRGPLQRGERKREDEITERERIKESRDCMRDLREDSREQRK
jgi:hypothetical protein